ncbi:unnamed protein product [Somion occarium]|uniref:Uncharacterized protein n=1 Tax=Somion occarium TaxID=3059160 RepID=A0ABP1CEW2_9APHY
MDAIGAILNLTSLIELAYKVTANLSKYYSDVKEAENSRQRFTEELRAVVQTLESLKDLHERLLQQSSTENRMRLAALDPILRENSAQTSFYMSLKDFMEWLEKKTATQSRMGRREKLRWPLKGKKKIEKLMP